MRVMFLSEEGVRLRQVNIPWTFMIQQSGREVTITKFNKDSSVERLVEKCPITDFDEIDANELIRKLDKKFRDRLTHPVHELFREVKDESN